jgi:hypothetical protein
VLEEKRSYRAQDIAAKLQAIGVVELWRFGVLF